MKKTALILVLTAITSLGFSQSMTQSHYVGDVNFQVGNEEEPVNHGIVGVGYREVSSVRDYGFYYGADLFVGAPVVATERPGDEPTTARNCPPGSKP